VARALPEIAAPPTAAGHGRGHGDHWAVGLILACYLLAAAVVTWHLWADPAAHTVAGNPNDADLFAWFLRYDATAVAHGRLPALVTAAMNAPQGINLMWNTSILLPGVLLAPVTLLLGPQTALTVAMTVGFAGSAASLFLVLRRWEVSTSAAALAGAVYGFSPALLQASIGHYNLQLAVLPPLIIDAALRLCLPRGDDPPRPPRGGLPRGDDPPRPPRRLRLATPVRAGAWLGLLATAQLFTGEELLLITGLAGLLLVAVAALGQPRAAAARFATAAAGLGVAAGVLLLLAGYALWVQFFGPLTQHGSSFLPDFYKNDLTGFVTPSQYLLFHTAASAAAAASYQGGAPEYLAYLGGPLIVVLVVIALAFWRQAAVRATAVTLAVLVLLSLGGHPLIDGTVHAGVTLPWHWLEAVPVLGAALPDRLSIIADGAAAALLALGLDQAKARAGAAQAGITRAGITRAGMTQAGATRAGRARAGRARAGRARAGRARAGGARGAAALLTAGAVVVCLPLTPRPLPAAQAPRLPAGWSAALTALRLPASARVLVVPVPTATLTAPLRWQADTAEPGSLIGGYFVGPAWNGQAYVDGNGVAATAQYLDALWLGGPVARAPAPAQVQADLRSWRPAAVVAVTSPDSALGRYLKTLFGPATIRSGNVLAWRR
jgi:hypothetical protein